MGDNSLSNEAITADNILKDAFSQKKQIAATTKADILDLEELKDWQRRKRTEYETVLKRNRLDLRQWMRYAQFEFDQKDIRRARSIYERALLVDHGFIPLWIQYIDSEIKWKNINHARNLLDRATNALPRVDKLWFKYLLLEESLGNQGIVRGIYTRWCSFEPGPDAWDSFIEFETRCLNFENVRNIYSKFVLVHPQIDTWLKWVRFEQTHGDISSVRTVFSFALDTLTSFSGTPLVDIERVIGSFASWEASQGEYERSRTLYRLAVERWPISEALKEQQIQFEKKFGSSKNMEDIVIAKRKAEYEQYLKSDPYHYSTWWVYIDLVEEKYQEQLTSAFQSFIELAKPKSLVKDSSWKRYIRICVRYLVYLELTINDLPTIRSVYQDILDIIPHKKFTFGKLWIMYAEFEIRQNNLLKARKILGVSLGKSPKPKVFKYYINLEIRLKEFDRVRKLYEKYIDFNPSSVQSWLDYAELEENLGDEDRSRGIYDISMSNNVGLSESDQLIVIQRYIAFETDAAEYEKARELYEKYLILSRYDVNIWINQALFESTIPTETQLIAYQQSHQDGNFDDDGEEEFSFEITPENKHHTRAIFEKAISYFKEHNEDKKRQQVLQSLLEYEKVHGNQETLEKVNARQPSLVREKVTIDNIEQESYKLDFPDDRVAQPPIARNLLALAKQWEKNSS
ncbi:Clf1p [Kluyveromyces lactis]|uniref:Pre-mRNA-splicing factor CLF1 n=1 Tax=Kluyveromyces lactis (strain ATCC 8585 / CBS 2359 / DSM 70799 / NBRC 1267 / NRRL Y-1140 / WM37) TaxID=284590 RepID=CLF1_KLULA|nr:uncharacterized protein KLLA0_F17996g [Kluyveromyces lactis]Q6CJK2.1 RecName: Full=Pre-mRNA-splicing factor CLF1 [Kluyveromyces lactis NRRL Y-1140]CAG98595.1 KLLA0F17996p [Kluyveromyces lactis]|eukprot:XP_455887.1 uncharacterized protein KLLA0_F17996g [Kluyveromyces lactis]